MSRRGFPVVVAAPSGTGKTTVCRALVGRDAGLVFSVSHTTRERRPGETDGTDYHFVTDDAFRKMVDDGAFLDGLGCYTTARVAGGVARFAERHAARLAGLLAGCYRDDVATAGRSLIDHLVESSRATLIPGFDAAKTAASRRALRSLRARAAIRTVAATRT